MFHVRVRGWGRGEVRVGRVARSCESLRWPSRASTARVRTRRTSTPRGGGGRRSTRGCRTSGSTSRSAAAAAAAAIASGVGRSPMRVRAASQREDGPLADAQESDPRSPHQPTSVEHDDRGCTRQRIVAVPPRHLAKRPAGSAGRAGTATSRPARPAASAVAKRPMKNPPPESCARRPGSDADRRVERQHHRRKLGRRIRVRQAAADRAPSADRRVRDEGHRLGEKRRTRVRQAALLQRRGAGSSRRSQRRRPSPPRCRQARGRR